MALPGMDAGPTAAFDWAGSTSQKYFDRNTNRVMCRKIVPTGNRNGDPSSLARQGLGGFAADTSGLIQNEGKRYIDVPGSEVYLWKPSKRSLEHPGTHHFAKPEGRRTIERKVVQVKSIPEKLHIRQVESKQEIGDLPRGTAQVYRANGFRAVDQQAQETDISGLMQGKSRKCDHLLAQRNGMGCKSLGDKPYKHPEYQTNFFQAGEFAVGSSFVRGHHKKTEARNSTNWQQFAGADSDQKRQVITYEEKQRRAQGIEAQQEVADLTALWERGTLKECDPKYEDLEDSGAEEEAPTAYAPEPVVEEKTKPKPGKK